MAVCELEQSGADFLEGVLEKYDTHLWVCNDEAYFSKVVCFDSTTFLCVLHLTTLSADAGSP